MRQRLASHKLDANKIIKDFTRAAPSYNEAAVVAREVGQRMLSRLDLLAKQPHIILDLGAGTGYFTAELQQRYPQSQVIALDKVTAMLMQADKTICTRLCADSSFLPLKTHSVDLIFSNLLLPWCDDQQSIFMEIRRVLRPEGVLMFTSFGPDTLRELRMSFAAIDEGIHVHHFWDMHDVGDALLQAGLLDPVLDVEYLTITYANLEKFFLDLKSTGMTNKMYARQKGLTTPRQWQKMLSAHQKWRDANDRWPVTYEIVYGHAIGSQNSTAGEVRIPINQLRRRVR